ncbi:MAG: 1-deoxy-D-xylulose-5-phosphate synthase [Nocardioidaceae bacterium]
MGLLQSISGPADLRGLDDQQLDALAQEIRDFLVEKVSRTGGHLGPNLGVVELTLAIHRVFDSPRDPVVFDTGHQSYVHKILTGRAADFDTLRQRGGLSGYPSRAESPHDWVENSHASTSLSYADGLAKAAAIRGDQRHVVALIGDGALTGGMAWEALNNIAAGQDRPLVIVVNDNGRSYQPTVGGLAAHLGSLRTNPRYERVLELIKSRLTRTPMVGTATYDVLHGIKKGLKDVLAPQGLFEDLGLKYVGPIDGHDRATVEAALEQAKGFGGPVIVHTFTRKGMGYHAAECHEADLFHSPGPFDIATGEQAPKPRTWTKVFSDALVELGERRADVVAVTAAMMHPTGLDAFRDRFPGRAFDVGIAEQHATTSAAGMAMAGLHPVIAVYSTFLNRAFDQVLLDVALHNCGVTFVLDRAGVTGPDGASHHGMWDMSALQIVPGLRLAAPRDGVRLRELLDEAADVDDAPTVLRFPTGAVGEDIRAVDRVGGADVIVREGRPDVLLVGIGSMVTTCVEVAEKLVAQGVGVTLVDPRWVKPVDPDVVALASEHQLVVSVEDNGRVGGCGAALTQAVADAHIDTPVRVHGIPQRFLQHAKRATILEEIGLTTPDLVRSVVQELARIDDAHPEPASGPVPLPGGLPGRKESA